MKDITLVNNNFELYQAKTEQNKEDIIFKKRILSQHNYCKIYTPPEHPCC
jgi:hypothetical protein